MQADAVRRCQSKIGPPRPQGRPPRSAKRRRLPQFDGRRSRGPPSRRFLASNCGGNLSGHAAAILRLFAPHISRAGCSQRRRRSVLFPSERSSTGAKRNRFFADSLVGGDCRGHCAGGRTQSLGRHQLAGIQHQETQAVHARHAGFQHGATRIRRRSSPRSATALSAWWTVRRTCSRPRKRRRKK